MDVFTNALEGVRQYFQGLPAATGSTAGPAYQQGNIPDQAHDRSSSGVSYWPPQPEAVVRLPSRDETQQRPPSHLTEPAIPPSHHNVQSQQHQQQQQQLQQQQQQQQQQQHQLQQQQQQQQQQHDVKVQVQNSYANPSYHEATPHSSQSFQFSMPQSRDTPSNVSQQHYQSHILPNISYHQPPSTQQPSRTHSRQDLTSPHSYHQLQPPQSPSQQTYNYPNQLPNRSYYPVQQPKTKPVTPTNTNYKVASSQSYNYDPYKSYVSQSSLPTANAYAPSKIVASHTQEIKQNNQITQPNPTSQGHRTTHNLPPIAALSNYPISRSSRETLRVPSGKSRTVTSTSTTTTQVTSKTVGNVSVPSQQSVRIPTHSDNTQQNYRNTTPQYSTPNSSILQNVGVHNTSPSYNYTVPSTTSTSSYSTEAYFPSSTNHNVHIPTKVTNQDQRTYQHVSNHPVATVVDSVLDLSLKTIKTSADSTLDDTDDVQRNNKYYQANRQIVQQVQQPSIPRYSANDGQYASSLYRKVSQKSAQQPSASAPKFDFLPNFNMPLNQSYKNERARNSGAQNPVAYDKTYPYQQINAQQQRYHPPINSVAAATPGTLYATQTSIKKSVEGLPRIDFPPTSQVRNKNATVYQDGREVQRKRTAEPAPTVASVKKPKLDDRWRKAIDQQIEQKFSSYQSRIQDGGKQSLTKPIVNGNYPSQQSTYHANQYQMQSHSPFNATNQYHQTQVNHNQTYVPSAVAHQYPGYHPGQQQQQQQQQQQALYQQQNQHFQRVNSHPSLPNRSHAGGGADKRVLSILRSNLEMKGAKEAQKKLEQGQLKSCDAFAQRPREVQHPSTDVMAPFQPKPSIIGRHNVSPFTASSLLERNSNTPPTYKCPKAIDSVRFESEIKDLDKQIQEQTAITNNSNTDLDGLAANLAARIRTKGELKQVAHMQQAPNKNLLSQIHNAENNSPNKIEPSAFNGAASVSPPKLAKEKMAYPPRRRLFSKTEDDPNAPSGIAPPRDKTGLRSSSETSVFDFPDSDSETEMPALEDMRRDRKSVSKQSLINENDFKDEPIRTSSPFDVFDQACDSFVEQLKKGGGKKRGRRKKMMEPDVLAKLETVTKEKPLELQVVEKVEDVKIKQEDPPIIVNSIVPKIEDDTDSDVPLIQCMSKVQPLSSLYNDVQEVKLEAAIKKTDSASDSSDSETDNSKNVEEKRRTRDIRDQIRKNKELTALMELTASAKPGKKPTFGDGSDFYPGWEEELYRYKKSLRMPSTLIHVTRPPNCHRLSTSLPDLDPCPLSPTASSVTDNMEYCKFKTKTKSENFDSDMDSNSSFNFSFTKTNYDSEEGSSSVKSLNISGKSKDSILDRLLEKYVSSRKRRRAKKKDELNGPKGMPKADSQIGLLPTASLELCKDLKKSESVIKGDSIFFGFRKKTIKNLKDAFIKNSSSIVGVNEHLTTVVLATRTRTETRVLKQKATIREVFGEDRPASAPPVTCIDDLKESKLTEVNVEIKKESSLESKDMDDSLAKPPDPQHTKEVLKNKLLNRNNRKTHELLKVLASKKFKGEFEEEEKEIKQEADSKSETPSLDGEEVNIFAKKRSKLRNMRRKGSSGFDYIRKKKKVKKENNENETSAKPKRRGFIAKASPESVQDIQKEIKMWVLNKGIGETHLHRSARLGYTDVTAYCLEKMECAPSPKDNAGYTPLHEACSRGHLNIAKLLLKYGANVSESAQGGIRPLHEAAENGFVEIVRLLLSYGADPMLATYSGSTPLSLATEESTVALLTNHVADIKGQHSIPWNFHGPATCFDSPESGYDPLGTPPEPDPASEEEDVEFEVSDVLLPNLYTFQGETQTERWVLLQDLSAMLKIKSRDALMKQINPPSSNSSSGASSGNKNILREMKMSDFLERAHCCQFLNAGEKINCRSSKIALVKYTEKVRQLLNVEKVLITVR